MAGQETNKTMNNTTHNCTRKCSECGYRKWYGDYSLYLCEISRRVILPLDDCEIPDDIYNEYNEEICRPKMKMEEN